MELRHVVTCFLSRQGDGAVLLGRRSERVRTYPGRWAAISGYLEQADPLAQALREVQEETGLSSSQVELVSQGRPLSFPDWELATLWTVHPFLFRCLEPERARPDWEHVTFQWVAPDRIAQLPTVPRLLEAYRLAEAGLPDCDGLLQQVAQDRSHGAEELGLWTLEALQAAARAAASAQAVARQCRRALALRPSMAPVRSAALDAFRLCRQAAGQADARPLAERIGELIRRRQEASLAAASAAAAMLPDGARAVTLSYSFTVLAALRDAAPRLGRLTVAESRPACEGRETARLAASFGIPTELVTDAAAPRAVADADVVLFGADALLADGSVVNKTGTLGLCCAAAQFGKMAVCAATRSKALPAGARLEMEQMPPGELGPPIPGVHVSNQYFELVPAPLVGRVVVEDGLWTAERARQRAHELRELEDELLQEGAG